MANLTFDKKLTKYCFYCAHGQYLEYSDEVFCTKKGFVQKFGKCIKYKYDPLKRKPDSHDLSNDYSKEDFTL